MKTVFKHTCSECGQASKFTQSFLIDDVQIKNLCDNCLISMGLYGFAVYRNDIKMPCKYHELSDYRDMLEIIKDRSSEYPCFTFNSEFDKNFHTEMCLSHQLNMSGILINKEYVSITRYSDLKVKTEDIIAVTMDSVSSAMSIGHSYTKVSFFTNNPMIPYFATIVSFKCKTTLSSKREKQMNESLRQALTAYCFNLKYEIDSPKKVCKCIKKDTSFHIPGISKKDLCDWLFNDECQRKYFSADNLLVQVEPEDDSILGNIVFRF